MSYDFSDAQLEALFVTQTFLSHLMDTMADEIVTKVRRDSAMIKSLLHLCAEGYAMELVGEDPVNYRYFQLTLKATKEVWRKRADDRKYRPRARSAQR